MPLNSNNVVNDESIEKNWQMYKNWKKRGTSKMGYICAFVCGNSICARLKIIFLEDGTQVQVRAKAGETFSLPFTFILLLLSKF